MKHEYSGEAFLNRLYRDIHIEKSVIKNSNANDSKNEKIRKYLKRIEDVHKHVLDRNKLSFLKNFYYRKYVIKKENITDKYFEHLKQIYLERGYGHVTYTETQKEQEKEVIINDQKKSLDTWIDYFVSEDSNMYPMWFKYYAFLSVVKLGSFDKANNTFNKRTENTIAIFPDLNREALSLTYDYLEQNINGNLNIEDENLEQLIKSESFKRIYAYIIKKLSLIRKEEANRNEGKWIKYKRGTDHMQLVKSLEGKGTGWCTAGESTAKSQLAKGDFYVYYSNDSDGNPTIPRIAIRMENNKIGEIRGVAQNQNLEPEMEEILDKKLEEFPDSEAYKKKVQDMNYLTEIYKKNQRKEDLTKEELRFLYEVDNSIQGFGYEDDPRIKEIKDTRNAKKDLAFVFNCKKEQIGFTKEEALSGNCVFYYGDLILSDLTSTKGLKLPKRMGGSLILSGLTSAEGLVLPKTIGGSLILSGLTSAEGLVLPKTIGGFLNFNSLTNAENLVLPETIGKSLYLSSLTSAKDLVLPKKIGGSLILNNITSAEGLILPEIVEYNIYLGNLISTKDLVLPKKIGGSLILNRITSAEGLILPKKIGGLLDLRSLTSAKDLVLPEIVGGYLDLSNLTSAEGLVLPKTIGDSLDLSALTSAKGLILPKNIGDTLNLSNLTNIKDLVLPETIVGNLYLSSLTNTQDLKLPKKIGGSLDLRGLTSAEGLILPKKIGGSLNLNGLTNAKDLVLPLEIGIHLNLNSITSAEGLILPKKIGGSLDLSSLTNVKDLILPEIVGDDIYLYNLEKVEKIVLPKKIKGTIFMPNLLIVNDVVIPDNFDFYSLYCELISQMQNEKKGLIDFEEFHAGRKI